MFSLAAQRLTGRRKHAAILLSNGKVLVPGVSDNRDWRGEYSSAEVYDPARGTFAAAGSMGSARFKIPEAVALLKEGRVLIARGTSFPEVYDNSDATFSRADGSLEASRFFASVTLLPSGEALITGGYADIHRGLPSTSSAWLYRP